MRIPVIPPMLDDSSRDALGEHISALLALANSEEWPKLVARANGLDYWHWEKFRSHNPFPVGVAREQAWISLAWSRMQNMQALPIRYLNDHVFWYWVPSAAQELLHYIDKHAAGDILLEEESVTRGDRDRYIVSSLIEEAMSSSILEGAAVTRAQAKQMLRSGAKPKNRDEQMILNNYLTMQQIQKMGEKEMTSETLLELQSMITQGTLKGESGSGRFRTERDNVNVVDVRTGEVLFVPPAAKDVPDLIDRFCTFANQSEGEFVHPVIRAILLHFWIGFVHPFVDGNGRTARAVFYWYMIRNKYWLFEFITISRILMHAPVQYGMSYLYSERSHGDCTYFVMHQLKVIKTAIDELRTYLRRKREQTYDAVDKLRKLPGLNMRQRLLMRNAITHPGTVYTIETHRSYYQVTPETARKDLFDLTERGYLEKLKVGRTYHFISVRGLQAKLEDDFSEN